MPIGVPNVICLCDNNKRGCNVMVVLRGSTEPVKPGFSNESTGKLLRRVEIDWRCKYCTNAIDSAISTNEAFTSLAMPVAMSTMIDEASVTGWLSASCFISSKLTYSKCIKGSTYYLGDKQGFDVLSVLLFFVSFKS